jgi:hypothetical protein
MKKFSGFKIQFERFNSFNHLINAIDKRPVNSVFENRTLASIHGSERFTATESYEQSVELIKRGYKDPMKQIKEGIGKTLVKGTRKKQKEITNVVGHMPCIPNALMGLPEFMYDVKTIKRKAKTINLVYSIGATCGVKTEHMIKGGILFLSLVYLLESEGFKVKIDLLNMSATTDKTKHVMGFSLTVKDYSTPLNVLKMCYPLVHPSMLRRTSFKHTETFPNLINKDYARAYGTTLDVKIDGIENEKGFLKQYGILKENQYYTSVTECMNIDTIDELKIKMGLSV